MEWFEVWDCILKGKTPSLNAKQKQSVCELKQRANAILAREERRKSRIDKKKYSQKSYSKWTSRELDDEIYPQTAKYFEQNYDENFYRLPKPKVMKNDEIPTAQNYFAEGARTPVTKHNNYLHARYKKIVEEALQNRAPNTDYHAFIVSLYMKVSPNAFSRQEHEILKAINRFAMKIPLPFYAVKRSDRRTVKNLKLTYWEFCEWYEKNNGEYSCVQRFFVPLFCRYWSEHGILYAPTQVDRLLRYDIYPKCFTPQDWQDMCLQETQFLNLADKIRKTSKKK